MHAKRSFDAEPEGHLSLLVDLPGHSDTAVPRIVVSGEVDALNADQLQETVRDVLIDHRPRHIQIDFNGVTFLDSAGIRALLLCHASAQQTDCLLTLTNPRPVVYRVLEITGLLEHFGVTTPPSVDRPPPSNGGVAHLGPTG